MKEWIKNKMKKMTIVQELHKLVSDKNILLSRARECFSFVLMDFKNILGSSFEGTMSIMFHEPFMSKFADYASPKLKKIDILLWIVEDMRTKQVYKIVQKLHLEYVVSNSHYIAAPTEGAYSTLKVKKSKVVNILCLYFLYKAKLLKV